MATFSVAYTQPGVYVDIRSAKIPATPPGDINLAIIGHASLQKQFLNTAMFRGEGLEDVLPYADEDIYQIYTEIRDEFGDRYFIDRDFVKDEYSNKIVWLEEEDSNRPMENTTYYVSGMLNKKEEDGDFNPKYIDSDELKILVYGNSMKENTDGKEARLPKAIDLALGHGAGHVYGVQINPNDFDGIKDAINKLRTEDIQLIVIADDITPDELSHLTFHVEDMSDLLEGKFRRALVGMPLDSDNEEFSDVLQKYEDMASVNSSRIGIVGPSNNRVSSGFTNPAHYQYGGWVLASAIAGIIANPNNNPGEPISGKLIGGDILEIGDRFTTKQKNRIAGKGITLVEKTGAINRVRHFLSTDMSSPITQELKITGIADYMARITISALTAIFVNTRNLGSETIANIEAVINLLSTAQIDNGVLTAPGIQNMSITRNELEPRQIDVEFEILPVFDLNWIKITMGVTF